MVTSRTYWQFRPPANFHCHQPWSNTNQLPQGRPGGAAMALTGPLLPTRLNHECSNFQKSITFLSISHNSATSSNLQPHFMLAEPNQVIKWNLGSIHMSKQRTPLELPPPYYRSKLARMDLCLSANITINKTKANSWRDLLHSAMSNTDGWDVWKVIRGLSSTPDTNLLKKMPSLAFSKNVWTFYLLTTKAAPPSTCQNSY